jgi:predicted phage-related endonuclease
MEKTGYPMEDISHKLAVKLGLKLEQAVAELFEEETGKKVHRVNETVFHKKYDFLAANLDRKVEGEKAVLECKTTSAFRASEFKEDEMPGEYIFQCLHYLMVTGYDKAYLAVLIGNQDFKWITIDRDDQKLKDLEKREVAWWEKYIIRGVMPTEVMAQDDEALQTLYPHEKILQEIPLGDEASILFENLQAYEQDKFILEKEIDEAKNRLKQMIAENDCGTTDLYRATWKYQESIRVDSKKLKANHPKIYDKCSNKSSTRVFRWNPINKEAKQNGNSK